MNKRQIKISFINFWEGFNAYQNIITSLLSEVYDVCITDADDSDLDLLVMSCFGDTEETLRRYCSKVKILEVLAENIYPNFNGVDYSINYYNIGFDRNFRLPHWAWRDYDRRHNFNEDFTNKFENEIEFTDDMFERSDSIPMAVSNGWRDGTEYVSALMQNFDIKSCGKWLNNTEPLDNLIESKVNFFKNFKFSMAFENADDKDYVTEKIYESFVANTIPIYYGPDTAKIDFNPKAFINVKDYPTMIDLVHDIKDIMTNKNKYADMITQKRILNYVDYDSRLKEFLINIIENGKIYNHRYGGISWFNYGSQE